MDVRKIFNYIALSMLVLFSFLFASNPFASSSSDIVFYWNVSPKAVTVDVNKAFDVTAEVRKISGEGYVEIRIIPTPGLDVSNDFIISDYLRNITAKASVPVRAAFGGNYTLRVVALAGDNPSNLERKDEQVINIVAVEKLRNLPRVTISASTISGFSPLTVEFKADVVGGVPPYTYQWRFSDKSESSEANPTHTFKEPGFYSVTLNIKDSRSIGSSAFQVISVYEEYKGRMDEKESKSSNAVLNGTISNGGKCLIATAAFGSELSPQVQFLRDFRDEHILSTAAGSSFMNVFNAWYYSFSPYVADYERSNVVLKETIKYMIYPLIEILQLSENVFHISNNAEFSVLFSGFVASSMIGVLYFTPITYAIKRVRTNRPNNRIFITALGSAFSMLLLAIFIGNQSLLMVTTSLYLLSLMVSFPIYSAWCIYLLQRKFSNRA